jgi:hypothetical protein
MVRVSAQGPFRLRADVPGAASSPSRSSGRPPVTASPSPSVASLPPSALDSSIASLPPPPHADRDRGPALDVTLVEPAAVIAAARGRPRSRRFALEDEDEDGVDEMEGGGEGEVRVLVKEPTESDGCASRRDSLASADGQNHDHDVGT